MKSKDTSHKGKVAQSHFSHNFQHHNYKRAEIITNRVEISIIEIWCLYLKQNHHQLGTFDPCFTLFKSKLLTQIIDYISSKLFYIKENVNVSMHYHILTQFVNYSTFSSRSLCWEYIFNFNFFDWQQLNFRRNPQYLNLLSLHGEADPSPGGDFHVKRSGMLVGNFELNP